MERILRSVWLLGIAVLLWAAPVEAQIQRETVRSGAILAWPDRHLGEAVELVGELDGVRVVPGGLELTLSNRRRFLTDAPPEARFRVRLADPVDPAPFVVGRLFRVSGVVAAAEAGEAVPLLVEGRGVEALDSAGGPGSLAIPPPAYLPPGEPRPGVVPYPYPVYVPVPVPRWPGHPWWRPPSWHRGPVSPGDPHPRFRPRPNPPDQAQPNAPAPGPPQPNTPSAAPIPSRPPQPGGTRPGAGSPPAAQPNPGGSRPRWIKPEASAPAAPGAPAAPAAPTQGRSPSPSSIEKQ